MVGRTRCGRGGLRCGRGGLRCGRGGLGVVGRAKVW